MTKLIVRGCALHFTAFRVTSVISAGTESGLVSWVCNKYVNRCTGINALLFRASV